MRNSFWLLLLISIPAISQTEFEKGEKLFRQGNYKRAQSNFKEALVKNPSNLKAMEYLGDIKGIEKDWDSAIIYYKRLKYLKPNVANYHYKYGCGVGMKAKNSNKLKALGMIPEVRQSFEKAISLNPKHIDARWALIELYLQLPGIAGGSEKKANEYSNELLAISPIDGWLAKGRIAEYFKRYPSSEKYYKKAVEIGGSKNAYTKLADLYLKMNQPEKAKAVMAASNKKNKP